MAEKFTDKVKGFFLGEPEEEFDEYEDDFDVAEEVPIQRSAPTSKILNIQQSASQVRVVIYEPVSYDEDAPAIIDSLKSRKVCIVNLENIEDSDTSKTIFNFLNGAIYAINGNIRKISKGIFILAPSSIDIDGSVKRELEDQGYFRWQ